MPKDPNDIFSTLKAEARSCDLDVTWKEVAGRVEGVSDLSSFVRRRLRNRFEGWITRQRINRQKTHG